MACVLNTNEDMDEIKVRFLHPHGPAASFSFPRPLDILKIKSDEVRAILNPVTATRRTYSLSQSEMVLCSKLESK
jgi:hypothetical protein